MKRILTSAAFLIAFASAAFGQSVQYSGPTTPNTSPVWSGTGIIKGGNTATDSPLTTFGVTRNAADGICVSSDRSTAAGRNQLCLQAATSGPAKISLQNYGTAAAQNLQFILNGVTLTLPSGGGTFVTGVGPYTVGHASCFNSTSGIIQDCGVGVGAGTQWGVPYFSTADVQSSTAALTAGQLVVGQTGAAPTPRTLSGDVSSISAAGAVTLNRVNGIPFASTYANHGVLLGQGSNQFNSLTTNNIGQCLLSQGNSSDPIWSSCASGAGSAGGSNTQVQFNNATALSGNPNFTWVSPTLTLGLAGSTTGQLALAPSAGAGGTVTLQNPSTTSAYNFNLPTSAGTTGQVLLSGGGGANPMSFGSIGVAVGGTGCTAASGTCLDNITGFSGTGYINRTGAGTYVFSPVVSVSGGGTALSSGTSGGILGFTSAGTIASSAALTQFGLVIGGGAGSTPSALAPGSAAQFLIQQSGANPSWNSMSGDATLSASGALTIANSAVTNAKLANATAAYSFKGNTAGSSGPVTDFTPASLTNKASPAAADYIVIADNAAAGQLKYATVSSISSAGSVSSIAGNTGSFLLQQPLSNSGNTILLNATIAPQGRLTLTSVTPVMSASVAAATTVYYTPAAGNMVPLYDGTNMVPTATAEISQATTDTTKSPAAVAASSLYDIFVWNDAGTIRATRGPAWTNATTRSAGTALVRVNGILLNNATITNGPAASRGTYVGTILSNAGSTIDYIFGASVSGGTAAVLGVWNAYNRVNVTTSVIDIGTLYTYSSSTIRQARASAGNQITVLAGLQEDGISLSIFAQWQGVATAGTFGTVGIGVNSTTAFAASALAVNPVATTASTLALNVPYTAQPVVGVTVYSSNESSQNTVANTFNAQASNTLSMTFRM